MVLSWCGQIQVTSCSQPLPLAGQVRSATLPPSGARATASSPSRGVGVPMTGANQAAGPAHGTVVGAIDVGWWDRRSAGRDGQTREGISSLPCPHPAAQSMGRGRRAPCRSVSARRFGAAKARCEDVPDLFLSPHPRMAHTRKRKKATAPPRRSSWTGGRPGGAAFPRECARSGQGCETGFAAHTPRARPKESPAQPRP